MKLELMENGMDLQALKSKVDLDTASIEEATAYGHMVDSFHLHEMASVVALAYERIEEGEGGEYSSIEHWGLKEFEWHKSTTYQYLQASKVLKLLKVYNCRLPERISHIRELFRFIREPETCYKVWNSAVSASEKANRKLTSTMIAEIGDEIVISRHSGGVPSNTNDFPEPEIEGAEWDVPGWEAPLSDTPPPPKEYKFITLEDYKKMAKGDKREVIKPDLNSDRRFISQSSASIEWADWSWNPVTGCLHNCSYCYARDIAHRFYPQGFAPTFHPDALQAPFNTEVPDYAEEFINAKNVFTCSMADLFGRWVPKEWIEAVLDIIREAPQWNFLFLTKFPLRLKEFDIPTNAWVGTSIDRQDRVKAAEKAFREVNAMIKWVSVEPMLEPIQFSELELFDWIVIGGASASTKTPRWAPPADWVSELIVQARSAGLMIYQKTNLINGYNQDDWISRLKEWPTPEYTSGSLNRKTPDSLIYWKK